jgi:putative membrane protein insertion efficiency factor
MIATYQRFINPLFANHCRFFPSCSHYAYQAISQYEIIKGGYLTLKPLLGRHPWHSGGHDPLPGQTKLQPQQSYLKG